MEKLLKKLAILKEELDNIESVKKIKKLNFLLKENKELNNLLEEYQLTKNERIKEEIIQNNLFQDYKHYETEVNLLILEINQELKEITKNRSCGL